MGKIEWSEHQWNPLAGCTMVSPGCTNCYAMKMAHRFKGVHPKYEGTTKVTDGGKVIWTGRINLDEKALMEPLSWKKPRRMFVNSMSDLFHESVPFEFIDKVFAVMALTPHITYMVLTKRPERMAEYFGNGVRVASIFWEREARLIAKERFQSFPDLLPNVWLGTTVENQEQADKRIPKLLECPAAVRFLSCEPLLGRVNLEFLVDNSIDHLDFYNYKKAIDGIQWVIAGGESGHGARPVHPDRIRSLRDQCQAAGVPFFFKQWGEWLPMDHLKEDQYWDSKKSSSVGSGISTNSVFKVGKKAAGRLLDGREWNEFPVVGGSEEGNV